MTATAIGATILDHKTKGFPGGHAPLALDAVGKQGWNVLAEDLPLPLMLLNRAALDHNSQWMRGFLAMTGAVVSPHGKTTMAPQLFRQQLDDGAWAITVATTHQMQVARDFGHDRIVMANQLVGKQAIRYVFDELKRAPTFDFYCLIDSVENVALLADAARAARIGRPLQLLLEGGMTGGRTGCRDVAGALVVARAVKAAAPYLALRGVEGFEGLVWDRDPGVSSAKVQAFLDFLVDIAGAADREKLFAPGEIVLSAGGSAFYDLVVKTFRTNALGGPVRVLTRSGCYLTHDSVMYRDRFAVLRQRSPEVDGLGEAPRPAIEVWAYVQSRPEPHQAIVTMGKRDIPFDPDAPVALKWHRPAAKTAPQPLSLEHVVTGLNDQHGYMTVPANTPLRVGDMVGFGISHPCLAFDKWQVIPVVDDAYNVVDAVKTYF